MYRRLNSASTIIGLGQSHSHHHGETAPRPISCQLGLLRCAVMPSLPRLDELTCHYVQKPRGVTIDLMGAEGKRWHRSHEESNLDSVCE